VTSAVRNIGVLREWCTISRSAFRGLIYARFASSHLKARKSLITTRSKPTSIMPTITYLKGYNQFISHRDTLSFFCDECDSKYKNRASLQKHMVLKHERATDAYECDECVEVFTKKILLTRHKEKKHNLIKKFLCQVVKKSCLKLNLFTHFVIFKICGEGLSNQQSLQLHVEKHNSIKKFHCDFCGASFHRKDKLIFHRRTHTGKD
jgi:Zinc finger, C2H2 type